MGSSTRYYKNTETGDYWEVWDIEKPYNVGQNTGLHVSLQLICTADFKNPLDVMSKEEYEEKGYESINCFVYSEGIDETAEANEYEVIGEFDRLPDEVKVVRKQFYNKRYSF